MRIAPALLAFALSGTMPLMGATIAETMKAHEVDLVDLAANPNAYKSMSVRFRCTFVQTADIFSSYHTQFTANNFLNFVAWDDTAKIWIPEERAKAVVSLYFAKNSNAARTVTGLSKYQLCEVRGEVVSSFRDEPWIKVHEVEPLDGTGNFTDNAIYHIEQAIALDAESRHELANEHFVSALADDLPPLARIEIQQLQAENLIRGKDYMAAADVLTEALEALGDDEETRQEQASLLALRARALSEEGERLLIEEQDVGDLFARAADDASNSLVIRPSDGDTYAVLGISLAGLDRFDEAKRQCERAIRLRPDNAEVRWYLGRILDLQESYDEAIKVLKQAIDLAPKDYRLHKAIAKTYFNRSNLGGAGAAQDLVTSLREYDIAIRLNPNDADLHHFSGVVLETATERKQKVRVGLKTVDATYDMAIERFQNCLSVDEAYTESHVRLGHRLRAKEQHDEAAGHFKRAIELEPQRFALYELLGRYLWDLAKKPEAYEIYQAYHERQPEHIDTLYALGRLQFELEQYETSVDWHLKLLKLVKTHAMAHADLTESYYELDNAREAIRHADAALASLEDEAQILRTHRFKGLTLANLMDQQNQAVLELDGRTDETDDARLPLALGWALTVFEDKSKKEEGDPTVDQSPARIQALAKQALNLDKDNGSATELLGWALYMAGEYSKAEAVLKSHPEQDNPIIAGRLGLALFKQGPERYGDAKPLVEMAADKARSRSELAEYIRGDANDAERAIRDYERQKEREARDAARKAAKDKAAAERAAKKKAEADRRAAEEARKKAEAEKKAGS